MKSGLSPSILPDHVRALAGELIASGHDALLVGGAVRDALLGESPVDFDMVSDARADDLRACCERLPMFAKVYELGAKFGTTGVAFEGDHTLELTTYRPDALQGANAAERFAVDASYRDFTVNAIALDIATGELLDPVAGRADVAAGVLRAPRDADGMLRDDPVRVLRAGRFVSELGFELDGAVKDALPAVAPSLAGVAVERVRDELTRLLLGKQAAKGMRVLQECGALEVVLPEVASMAGVAQPSFHDLDVLEHTLQALDLVPATLRLRWATLLHDVGKPETRTIDDDGRIRFFRHARLGAEIAEKVCGRLRVSKEDTAAIVHLVAEHMRLGELDAENPTAVDRAVRKLDLWVGSGHGGRRLVSAEEVMDLTVADFSATAHRDRAPQVRERIGQALAEARDRSSRHPLTLPINGSDIMKRFGLEEGPEVGRALDAVGHAIEDGWLKHDDREGALAIAERVLAPARDQSSSKIPPP